MYCFGSSNIYIPFPPFKRQVFISSGLDVVDHVSINYILQLYAFRSLRWLKGDTSYGSGIIILHFIHFISLQEHPETFGLLCIVSHYIDCCTEDDI
jgi:hypothetical protein